MLLPFRCGEKLARARDGVRRRRFAAKSCSICVRTATQVFRSFFFCLVAAVLLCFVATQCRADRSGMVHQGFSKGICSSLLSLDSDCALRVTVGRSRWRCYIKDAI